MRQARAHHDQRPRGLRQFVGGGAQRGHVHRRHVLHLVDEQGDAHAQVGRHGRGVREQLGEVDLQVA